MKLQKLIDGLKAHKSGAAAYESVDEAIRVFEAMRDMDGEKVCKGLECCIPSIKECQCVDGCPYYDSCWNEDDECDPMYLELMRDTLALIRQQQERIKELEAAHAARILSFDEALEADVCWLEARGVDRVIPCRIECTPRSVTVLIRKMIALPESMMREDYLIEWRPWSSRPTFEQREAVMWK